MTYFVPTSIRLRKRAAANYAIVRRYVAEHPGCRQKEIAGHLRSNAECTWKDPSAAITSALNQGTLRRLGGIVAAKDASGLYAFTLDPDWKQ